MAKSHEVITGHDVLDISLGDFAASAHKLAKEFRGTSQVAKSLILFNCLSQGDLCEATVAKKGHNNLVRLMLAARDELVKLQELRDEVMIDSAATIQDKIKVHQAIQKGLADLQKTALDVEEAAEAAANKASDFLVRLAEFRQKDRHHQDKMHQDIKSISDDEMRVLLDKLPPVQPDMDPNCMDAVQ